MIKYILERPLARPLILWIAGILLQLKFDLQYFSFILLIIPFLHLFGSLALGQKNDKYPHFCVYWTWGLVLSCMILFVSIQTTALHDDIRRSTPPSPSRLSEWADSQRQKLVKPLDKLQLTESNKAVLATVTLGGTGVIPREVRRQFATTGIIHILSVSGFHVAIVAGFIFFLLSFMGKRPIELWIRFAVVLSIVWTFTIVSGFASPSVRSAFMLTLYLVAKRICRMPDSYNILFTSALCALLYSPFFLFDVGFQLSYISVASIIFFQGRFNNLIKVRNPVLKAFWSSVTVSVAAQLGVSFLCFYYFGQISSIFLLVNLPVVLIANALVPLTLILMLLPSSLPFYGALQWIVEFLCESMMWTVETFSRVPGASINFRFGFLTMILCYVALYLLSKILFREKAKDLDVIELFDEEYRTAHSRKKTKRVNRIMQWIRYQWS